MLDYLLHLTQDRGLAYTTVGLHRSAISSLTQPDNSQPIGQHPLVSRFMKALFQHRPPAHKTLRPTWDVAEVLNTVKGWGPTTQLDGGLLARRTLMLVALASIKRISDLTLLDTSPGYMVISDTRVVFQLRFGGKQSRPKHTPPVVILEQVSDPTLCPVDHIKHYLEYTQDLRSSSALFVTLTPPHGAASVASLRSWLMRTLREAGINYPAGSTRAAAASFALAHRISISSILACGDWAKAKTMLTHYSRRVPGSVLQAIAHEPASTQSNSPARDS